MLIEAILEFHFPDKYRLNWRLTSVNDKSSLKLDKELIYSLRPNFNAIFRTGEFVELSQINSAGLRDFEISSKKEKFRILILGDSFTFGHGVVLENSYPKQLEQIIKEFEAKEVEVINAGVKGYNLDQEFRFFTRRLFEINPDLLVVTLGPGDFSWACDHPLYDFVDGELVPLDATKTWIYRQVSLYNKAPLWLKNRHFFALFLHAAAGRNSFKLDIEKRGEDWRLLCEDWSFKKSLKELINLRELGVKQGFKILIVFNPIIRGEDDDFQELKTFKSILKADNFFFVDPNDKGSLKDSKDQGVLGMETFNWDQISFRNDSHLTSLGNKFFAEVVYFEMAERGLLR